MENKYINGGEESEKQVMVSNKTTRVNGLELVLRFLSFALTFTAAIVIGTDKQTKIVAMSLVPSLPPLDVPVTAKWNYLSAFVYFLVANAIACAYAAISLILLLLTKKGTKKSLYLLIIICDLMMVALLFSCGGAAMAVGLLGYQGNSHVQWEKVCNVFGKFCSKVAVAWVISLLGTAAFFLMVLITTLKLHSKRM